MSPMFYPVLYNLSAQGVQVEPRGLNTYEVLILTSVMTIFIVLAIAGMMLLVKED